MFQRPIGGKAIEGEMVTFASLESGEAWPPGGEVSRSIADRSA